MSELIESDGNFYLNAEVYNSTSVPIDAVINITDRDDILKFQDRWACHITRFAVDTQASLYYVMPDNDAWVTLTCVEYTLLRENRTDTTRHFVDQRTLRMTKGASTLADFLEQLNENVPVLTRENFRHATSVAGAITPWKCGKWTVTPSGSFKFQAQFYLPGDHAIPGRFDDSTQEYMVNIKMSEKMRKILAFSKAHCRVQGTTSGFRRWKEMLSNFMDQLPAYRKNIRNWRWEGNHRHWYLNNWYREMWYIINNVILRGVPLNRLGYVDQTGHPNAGHFRRDAHFIDGVDIWEEGDFVICNYVSPWGRGAAGAYADSSHAHTHFAKIHARRNDMHGANIVELRNVAGQATGAMADHRWSTQKDQDGQTYAHEGDWINQIPHHSGRTSYWFNAKQIWGSWSRAYIIGVVNQRQIHLNREVIDPNNAAGANPGYIGGGGTEFGIPPKVGDTIYIPGSANLDGSGSLVLYISDYDRMQRGIITEVVESSLLRAPNLVADNTWLVTIDTELEIHPERSGHLNCRQTAVAGNATGVDIGDPLARVVYGTRRIPYQPMVYISEVSATVDATAAGIQFGCIREFPVSVGDTVYIGHEPHASEQAHLVTHVDYSLNLYTIEAHGVFQITENTVVIGMARDSVYDAMMAADKTAVEITAVGLCIRGRGAHALNSQNDTDLDHNIARNRIVALESVISNSESASHMNLTPDSVWGLRDLTETESSAPEITGYDRVSGDVTVEAQVLRAGGDGSENNVLATDFLKHMGATARFTRAENILGPLNNINSSPSNYFQVDMPEETGIYAEPILNNFIRGHFREDWFINLKTMSATAGVNNDGRLTPNVPGGMVGLDANTNTIQYNSVYVTRPQLPPALNGKAYLYKLCGLANLPALRPDGTSDRNNEKLICYTADREEYPGNHAGVHVFNPDHQFFLQSSTVGLNTVAPLFANLSLESGFRDSDGVQALFKGNTTLDITDNIKGVNLAVRTTDYFQRDRSGQVDVAMPFKSISITSNDLMAVPERSGDSNQLQPILSSYSIPTMFDAGTNTTGDISSFTSTPYGTITFSEGGARRYHNLSSIPGGLRQFSVRCVLDPKDDTLPKTSLKLPPGGRFSLQFVFVRKK